jgi:hypothetical protein
MQAENFKLRNLCAERELQLQKANQKLADAAVLINTAMRQSGDENRTMRTTCAELRLQLEKMQAENNNLKNLCTEQRFHHERAEQNLTDAAGHIETMMRQSNVEKALLQKINAELRRQLEQIPEKREGVATTIGTTMTTGDNSLQKLAGQIEELKQQNVTLKLRADNSTLRGACVALRYQLHEATEKVVYKKNRIEDLKQQIKPMMAEIEQLKKTCAELNLIIAQTRPKMEDAVKNGKLCMEELSCWRAAYRQLDERKTIKYHSIETAYEKIQHERKVEQLQSEIEALTANKIVHDDNTTIAIGACITNKDGTHGNNVNMEETKELITHKSGLGNNTTSAIIDGETRKCKQEDQITIEQDTADTNGEESILMKLNVCLDALALGQGADAELIESPEDARRKIEFLVALVHLYWNDNMTCRRVVDAYRLCYFNLQRKLDILTTEHKELHDRLECFEKGNDWLELVELREKMKNNVSESGCCYIVCFSVSYQFRVVNNYV